MSIRRCRQRLINFVALVSVATTIVSLFADWTSAPDTRFGQRRLQRRFKTIIPVNGNQTNSSSWSAEVTAEQQKRLQHLMEVCRQLPPQNWTISELRQISKRADTIFVDDRLHYIYCLVPKVACTTWTRVLLVAGQWVSEKKPNDIPQHMVNFYRYKGQKLRPLYDYSVGGIAKRLKHYFKFMFARHPLERLVSAFRDRLHGDHAGARRSLGSDIRSFLRARGFYNISQPSTVVEGRGKRRRKRRRRRRRKQKTPKKRRKGGISFEEFVRYVADADNQPAGANPHWRPHYDLCHPCYIHYDFIGRYDTLRRDADAVLSTIGAGDRVSFPVSDPDNERRMRTSEMIASMYSQLPSDVVRQLTSRVYHNDFRLFDFQPPEKGRGGQFA